MRPLRDSGRRSIGSTRHGDRLPFTIRFSGKLVKFSAKGIDRYIAVGSAGAAADDDGDHAVVYFGEPISSGYVLIERDHLVNVTNLEPERWKRAHAEVCRKMGIRWLALASTQPAGSMANTKSAL